MAVMLETLRLYYPLLTFTKSTGNAPRTIKYGSKDLHLPPNTMILPNLLGIQSHPRYWGSDRLLWRPSRWTISSSYQNDGLTEKLWTAPKGSYMPWSEGPRGCPGKKFSQVEFVAAMAGLFHRHRVEIVKEDGENQEEAEKRVKALLDDSAMVLLLQLMKSEKVGLRWVRK
ncbi:putative cytochrome p450 protein [Botrytis cinerea BcDW1]|uniref:Putative cytochrome p450 protein n=1 Tax=Botryotinia fuckeliana (strain BcDW1) TaxID=1290391 RepID=M7TVD4_BOTF1|nr:putative cytochrome p450 protein [Botrytis cinerea BcDW1]